MGPVRRAIVRGTWIASAVVVVTSACSLTYDRSELAGGPAPPRPEAGTGGEPEPGSGGTTGKGGAGAGGGASGGGANEGGANEGGANEGGQSGAAQGGSAGSAGTAGKGGAGGAAAGGAGGVAAGGAAAGGAAAGGASGAAPAGAGGGAGTSGGPTEIYWVEQGSDTVNRANADGSSPDGLVSIGLLSHLRSISVDAAGGKMYFSDDQRGRVQRADLDGSNVEDVLTSVDKPVGIDLDPGAGKLYVVDQGNTPVVYRTNLDGSSAEPIVTTGIDHPYGIALDLGAGHLYLADNGLNQLLRADLDGSNLTGLGVAGITLPIEISLDLGAGKLYWSELGPPPRIRRANLDGSGAEDVVTDAAQPLGLRVDAVGSKLYYVDGNGLIRRSELDGSGKVTLLSNLDGPVGLALR